MTCPAATFAANLEREWWDTALLEAPKPRLPGAAQRGGTKWAAVPWAGSRGQRPPARAATRDLTNHRQRDPERSGSRPISRVLSRTTIHLGRASPRASSDLPGNSCGPQVRARKPACFPIWSCSRWGLPCRRMLPPARCALTAPFHPCRHRIAAALGRSALCCTFRGLAPPRRYLAPCPVEPGLSSANAAVAWPTPARSIRVIRPMGAGPGRAAQVRDRRVRAADVP